MQHLAKSMRTWDSALFFGRSDFSTLDFIREKSDFLMKFPTSGKFVDISQEYIAPRVCNHNNDLFAN